MKQTKYDKKSCFFSTNKICSQTSRRQMNRQTDKLKYRNTFVIVKQTVSSNNRVKDGDQLWYGCKKRWITVEIFGETRWKRNEIVCWMMRIKEKEELIRLLSDDGSRLLKLISPPYLKGFFLMDSFDCIIYVYSILNPGIVECKN